MDIMTWFKLLMIRFPFFGLLSDLFLLVPYQAYTAAHGGIVFTDQEKNKRAVIFFETLGHV